MKEKLAFSVDPIYLTKHLLQRYVEEEIEGKTQKPRQFAMYEYMRLMTDLDCIKLVDTYGAQEKLEFITFEDWKNDCRIMWTIIESSDKYNELLKRFRLSAVKKYEFEEDKGVSGVLLANGDFLKCGYQEHVLFVEHLPREEQNSAIYFSSPLQFGKDTLSSGVISLSPFRRKNPVEQTFTDAQLLWLKENRGFFDKGQKETFSIWESYEFKLPLI